MRKNSMRKNTRMYGGAYNAMNLSLAQGREFNEIHSRQHGGGVPLTGAPVGDQGLLPADMRDIARIGPLDGKLGEIVGMHDPDQVATPQAGGGRRRTTCRKNMRKNNMRKASRKNNMRKSSRKNNMRKSSRKNNMRKASRKNNMRKSSRKAYMRKNSMRKASRKNAMMGGAYPGDGSPVSSPNMLLSSYQAGKAGTADFSNPYMRD